MALLTRIDGSPLWSTLEEALEYGSSNDLSGHHTHEFRGQTGYMAGANHAQQSSSTPTQYIEEETLGFCEENKRWNSFYSYNPDYMCGLNTGIVTFKNGEIYTHNSETATVPYNNFYGGDFPSELTVASNQGGSNNKVYTAFSQESDDIWDVEFSTPNGQNSALVSSDFDTRENIHYSDILNDTNSPGGIIEGDRIRDVTLLAKLRVYAQNLTRIFAVNFNFFNSHRSNK